MLPSLSSLLCICEVFIASAKLCLNSLVQTIIPLLSSAAARVLSDPEAFISYVGADNKIADPVLEDPSGLNRSRVSIITRRGVILNERRPASFHPHFSCDWTRGLLIMYFFRLQNNRLVFALLTTVKEHAGHAK